MHFDKVMQSKHRALFLQVRDLLLDFEEVFERKNAHTTSYWTKKGCVCHIKTTQTGLDVGFTKGVQMEDAFGRLWGDGKSKRNISLSSMDENMLVYYIVQALELIPKVKSRQSS